jgi:hypothetical protein
MAVWLKPTAVDDAFHGFLGFHAAQRSPSMWVAPGSACHGLHYGAPETRSRDRAHEHTSVL